MSLQPISLVRVKEVKMIKRKRTFSMAVIVMMLLNIFFINASPTFADGKWYDTGIVEAKEWMIIPESIEDESLNGFITRGEFAEVVIRAYLSANGNIDNLHDEKHFSDIIEVYPEVAYQLGIVAGYPNGTYGADDLIKREEIFVMIGKLMSILDLSKVKSDEQNNTQESDVDQKLKTEAAMSFLSERFVDGEKASPWASESIEDLVNSGVVKGGSSGLLSPKSITSRAQAIIMLKTALTKVRYAPTSAQNMSNALKNLEEPKVAIDSNDSKDESATDYFVSRGNFTRSKPMNFDSYMDIHDSQDPNSRKYWDHRSLEEIYTPEELLVRLGNNSVKYALVFGSATAERYQTAVEASKHMKSISFDVWVLNGDGTKSTGRKSITINENIAEIALKVFKDIYEGPEKFPIKNVGCYAWRASSTSEHRWGLAIDINSNENYMIRKDGTVVAGSFWKPGENPYSIKPTGDVVNAFKSNGFTWGGDAWPMSNDYMHFSFLGE